MKCSYCKRKAIGYYSGKVVCYKCFLIKKAESKNQTRTIRNLKLGESF